MKLANKWADRLDLLMSGDQAKIDAAISELARSKPIPANVTTTKTKPIYTATINTTYVPRKIVAKADTE